jgi:L-rhamnose mutarotase
MKRIGFVLKVKQDRIEAYKRQHEQVWPEMLQALREAGWPPTAINQARLAQQMSYEIGRATVKATEWTRG